MEPLLAKKITIEKDRSLTPDQVTKLLADVMEQPTQRPIRKQRKYYSGKKKRHTIKTEIVVKEEGSIFSISRSHPGRIHDFKIRKGERLLPPISIKLADSGYQGWQKVQSNVIIPIKRKKKMALTKPERSYNRSLSSVRMGVEHVIRRIKIFKIMSHVYRNFQMKYNLRFNIVAGLVNLKLAC